VAPPPSPRFDRSAEDLGNIVEFGHVNLRVPDQQLAIVFYVTGLGLTRDPYLRTGVDNAWINVGTSQFHLPVGPPQVLRGVVGLVMPDLAALADRLAGVRARLAGTRFAVAPQRSHIDLTCPWGNRIRVHAPDAARFGDMLLGMPYVEIDVAPGTAARIGRFYVEIVGARVSLPDPATVRVQAGRDGSLVFRETTQALAPYDGHHVQVSVADFSGVHGRLLARGLVSEESSQSQYRFCDVVDVDSGEVLVTLEHEVRSMRHPLYARPLVNRNPANADGVFAAGHEAAMWRLPSR
jgi:catechol 2,3-dioxygenase-like lactoylglutathione lyase family enzyme